MVDLSDQVKKLARELEQVIDGSRTTTKIAGFALYFYDTQNGREGKQAYDANLTVLPEPGGLLIEGEDISFYVRSSRPFEPTRNYVRLDVSAHYKCPAELRILPYEDPAVPKIPDFSKLLE